VSFSDPKLRVYVDANVILQAVVNDGSNPTAAPLVTVMCGELTLVDLLTCALSLRECARNLDKFAQARGPAMKEVEASLRETVDRALTVVDDPSPKTLRAFEGLADPKDVPHLAAAVEHACTVLVTANVRDFRPGHEAVTVVSAGAFVRRLRAHLRTFR
jgi:predicted nucleic acid-binding protein